MAPVRRSIGDRSPAFVDTDVLNLRMPPSRRAHHLEVPQRPILLARQCGFDWADAQARTRHRASSRVGPLSTKLTGLKIVFPNCSFSYSSKLFFVFVSSNFADNSLT